LIVCNPPLRRALGAGEDLEALYPAAVAMAKERLLGLDPVAAERQRPNSPAPWRMKASRREIPVSNGGKIDCRLV